MRRAKSTFLTLVAVLLLPMAANAGPIAFDFNGICELRCSAFGLSDGDAFAEENVLVFSNGTETSAGSNYGLADIQSFELFGIDFLARASRLDIETTGFISDGVLGAFVMPSSFCYNYTGRSCQGGNFATNTGLESNPFGSGEFVLATKVPEPGTLVLIAIGFLGIGFSRRKKA